MSLPVSPFVPSLLLSLSYIPVSSCHATPASPFESSGAINSSHATPPVKGKPRILPPSLLFWRIPDNKLANEIPSSLHSYRYRYDGLYEVQKVRYGALWSTDAKALITHPGLDGERVEQRGIHGVQICVQGTARRPLSCIIASLLS